jgi:hypothetical protein
MAFTIVSCKVFNLILARLESNISNTSFPVAALYSITGNGGKISDTNGSLNCVPKYDKGAIGF